MADHLLGIDRVDEGGVDWTFSCAHDPDDTRWFSRDPDGSITSHDCWLMSWWDGCGPELLNLEDGVTRIPMPVRPDDGWDYDNAGSLVADEGAP